MYNCDGNTGPLITGTQNTTHLDHIVVEKSRRFRVTNKKGKSQSKGDGPRTIHDPFMYNLT